MCKNGVTDLPTDCCFRKKNKKKTKKNKDNIMFSQSIWRNSQYKYNVYLQNIIFMYNINTDFSILTGLNKMRLSISTKHSFISHSDLLFIYRHRYIWRPKNNR
jgi:hypothetical protein